MFFQYIFCLPGDLPEGVFSNSTSIPPSGSDISDGSGGKRKRVGKDKKKAVEMEMRQGMAKAEREKNQSIKTAVLYDLLEKVTEDAVTARRERFEAGKKLLEKCGGLKVMLKMEVKDYRATRAKESEDGDVLDSDDDMSFLSLDSLGELVEKFVTSDDLSIKMKKRMESVEKKLEATM